MLLWTLAILPLASRAQAGTLLGVVHGRGSDADRLANVEITLAPGDLSMRTDSQGRFVFFPVAPGHYLVTARRVGLESAFLSVDVRGADTARISVSMATITQRLQTIVISGKRITYPARLAEAYARAARNTGRFFTAEQIDSLFPLDVNSLLLRVPGVRISGESVEFARCRELGSSDQHVQVYVDGQRFTRYSGGGQLTVGAHEVLKDLSPTSIQLIEIYSGVARLPGEFLDDACAVILIWRK